MMGMGTKTKKQHYVPRFYLRNFSNPQNGRYTIWCFNKNDKHFFCTPVENICFEKHFYGHGESGEGLEQLFRDIEGNASNAIWEIVNRRSITDLSQESKMSMSLFLASQFVRSKERRMLIKSMTTSLKEHLQNENLSEKLKNELQEIDTEEFIHSQHVSTIQSIPRYALLINKMKWFVFFNTTPMPLWTSDNPLVLDNNLNRGSFGRLGLKCRGIEIHIPLNPMLSLAVVDPIYSLSFDALPITDVQHIIYLNSLQVKQSTMFVFSKDSNFNLAEKILMDLPDLGDPNRKRVTLGDTNKEVKTS